MSKAAPTESVSLNTTPQTQPSPFATLFQQLEVGETLNLFVTREGDALRVVFHGALGSQSLVASAQQFDTQMGDVFAMIKAQTRQSNLIEFLDKAAPRDSSRPSGPVHQITPPQTTSAQSTPNNPSQRQPQRGRQAPPAPPAPVASPVQTTPPQSVQEEDFDDLM